MTEELLAQSRAYGTTDERVVIALESIADQLRLLVEVVTPIGVSERGGDSAAPRSALPGEGAWENEGGSLDDGSAASLGINHNVTDQFETGGYRYTKLADAIAEAKRARARSTC
jgi:hypothetical protein